MTDDEPNLVSLGRFERKARSVKGRSRLTWVNAPGQRILNNSTRLVRAFEQRVVGELIRQGDGAMLLFSSACAVRDVAVYQGR
jgi:hypothetical protein